MASMAVVSAGKGDSANIIPEATIPVLPQYVRQSASGINLLYGGMSILDEGLLINLSAASVDNENVFLFILPIV
jgi:hypothetical protein